MQINHDQLDAILADFSALARTTYLDDPVLDIGHAATALNELGIPEFSTDLPALPVALIERHQALWTHPDTGPERQEVWTEQALSLGMERIGYGVHKMPNPEGWLIAQWPRESGGLQLQQPDGNLFVYALCGLDPAWLAAARRFRSVLVLHGPHLGLKVPDDHPDADGERTRELITARQQGLVTGGIISWGEVHAP